MSKQEKLVEILQEREEACFFCEHYKKDNCPDECMEKIGCERLADYLLSHGVTIPVRCEDCKYYRNHPNGLCYQWTEPFINAKGYKGEVHCVEPDDYCSYGERKDNG